MAVPASASNLAEKNTDDSMKVRRCRGKSGWRAGLRCTIRREMKIGTAMLAELKCCACARRRGTAAAL